MSMARCSCRTIGRSSPNITLSGGLRYETQNSLGDHADFAPRVGFAWGIGGKGQRTVRRRWFCAAGFGIFYDRFTEDLILTQQLNNGITQQTFLVQNPAFFNPNVVVPPSGFTSATLAPQTIYQPNNSLRTPYTMQTGVSLEKQLTKSANISVTYLNARGVHEFYTNFINANAPGIAAAGHDFVSVSVGREFKQNQLIANGSIRMGTRLTLFGFYVLNYANSDTGTPTYVPSDPLDPSADYGRAQFDYRNRLFMGGTIGLPKGFRLSPFLIASSGQPFNITTGDDLFGNAQFSARPAFGDCSTAAPNLVQTKFGCFNTAPAAGAALIPINDFTGPARFTMNLRLSKTFGFGKKKEGAPTGPNGPGGGTFGRVRRRRGARRISRRWRRAGRNGRRRDKQALRADVCGIWAKHFQQREPGAAGWEFEFAVVWAVERIGGRAVWIEHCESAGGFAGYIYVLRRVRCI